VDMAASSAGSGGSPRLDAKLAFMEFGRAPQAQALMALRIWSGV
jgi:hypothetical protein